ncbi:L-rhamnose mutarotase [Hartmannibacter diazotrophicus]|uniref:L-rhamnose mutarotase n=1 Tax=Hartmannibacter diazotrophicus TaxID=1482074 RepID=A0A2C9DAA9_9HYPH|nr:L-rhamnose mutarotase [Hartmannibacter diazotrophicus]SON57264.1 L-rhamnose mutarotase [Hartmannibacter diazotrophicus]
METIAFRMILHPGMAEEYKRRHDDIWPDLSKVLKDAGVFDYSIWLDEETNHLFSVLKRSPDHDMASIPSNAIVRKWWDYMADIMAVEPGNRPVEVPLTKMFHLP